MEDTILCLSYNVFPCELVPLVRILIVSRKHHSKHTQAPSKVKYIESPIFILGSRKMLASGKFRTNKCWGPKSVSNERPLLLIIRIETPVRKVLIWCPSQNMRWAGRNHAAQQALDFKWHQRMRKPSGNAIVFNEGTVPGLNGFGICP